MTCPFCDHPPHDGQFCRQPAPCDCGEDHACACSYPDPDNYQRVPKLGGAA